MELDDCWNLMITALTDGSGNTVQSYSYNAFGETKVFNGAGVEINASSMIQSPYGYTAREWDSETSQYYYRSRYYDSRTGRFISEDPIHILSGETNFYRYVGNLPLNQTDPFGLLSFQGNYERRKCINKTAFLSIVKTTVSIVTGSEFLKSMAKTGFNTGLMDLIKNRFSVPGLTAGLGSIGNFAIAAAVKSVAYGLSFSAGVFTGNNIGAFFDTAVDNNESALGIDASILSDLGFGSGVSGNGGYSCDGECK